MKVTPLYVIMLALWLGIIMFLTENIMRKLLPTHVNTNNTCIIGLENFYTNKVWHIVDWDNTRKDYIHSTNCSCKKIN
jgi:hypothetical protein